MIASLMACPYCANQASQNAAATWVQIAMLALPFLMLTLFGTAFVREWRRGRAPVAP